MKAFAVLLTCARSSNHSFVVAIDMGLSGVLLKILLIARIKLNNRIGVQHRMKIMITNISI